VQRSTRHGEPKARPWRAKAGNTSFHMHQVCRNEFIASQLAIASPRRVDGEEEQRVKVQGNQISLWRVIASPGELRRSNLLKADMSETHWWSNVNSSWRTNLAWRVYKNQQMYKSLSSHFRWDLIILLRSVWRAGYDRDRIWLEAG